MRCVLYRRSLSGILSALFYLKVAFFFVKLPTATEGSGIPALQTPVGFFPLNITYNATNSNPGPVQQGNLSSVPPTLAPGPRNEYGGSFRFGGNREKPSYIKLPNNNLLDTVYAISLSAWVFPESLNGEIISYWKNSHLGVSLSLEENHVVFDLYSREDPKRLETLKSPSKLSLARWYHVGVTYNNVTDVARIWIDGRVVMSGYVTGAGGYEFLLRTQYDAWIGFLFKGRISQVGFWDVALTNENICSVQNYWQIHQDCPVSVPPVPAPTTSSYHYSSQTMSTISGKSSRDVRSTFYVSPTTTAHGSSRQSTSSYHTSNVTPAYHSSQTTTSAESPNATYSIESTTTTVSTPQWSSTAMLTPVNTSSQAESPSATPTQSVVVPAEVNTSSVTQAFVISLNGSTVSVSAASSYQSATISPTSVPTEGKTSKVSKPDLVAIIYGGTWRHWGRNETVILDASLSYDPQVGRGDNTGLTFHWSCIRLFSPVVCDVRSNGSVNATASLNSSQLEPSQTYNVTLLVRKGARHATTTQLIFISDRDSPNLAISCEFNCGPRVISSHRFVLSSHCTGSLCSNLQWQLFEPCLEQCHEGQDPLSGAPIQTVNLANWTYTLPNATNIVFKENVFNVSTPYIAALIIPTNNSLESMALYHFWVVPPPTDGVCSVTPSNGTALVTNFRILCSNWSAEDLLRYRYQYRLDSGYWAWIHYGGNSSVSSWLPSGDPAHGHAVYLRVTVLNLNGGSVDVPLEVQVFPSTVNVSHSLAGLAENTSLFNQYLKEGNIEKAALLLNTLLTSEASGIDSVKMKMVKEFILDTFWTTVTIDSLETVLLVSSVVGAVTGGAGDLPVQSISTALDLLDRMVSLLRAKADGKDEAQVELVQQAATNIVHCLGNVLKIGQRMAAVDSANVSLTTGQDQGKRFVNYALDLIDSVSEAVLTTKLVGDEATSIDGGDGVGLVVQRLRAADLPGLHFEAASGTFQLPPSRDLLATTVNATFIDIQMLSVPFNPYSWDYSRRRVHSDVLSLEIRDDNRNPITISDLQNNITITLPLHEEEQFDELRHFAKPHSLQYHKVDVPFENSLMNIEMTPVTAKSRFSLYVKYKDQPTRGTYDFSKNISSSCDGTKTANPCATAVVSFTTQLPGLYYIGILGEKIPDQNILTRKKRSCFGRRRQKRDCVEVKDPPPTPPQYENVTSKVKPVYDASTDANYTLRVRLGDCVYWSEEQETWVTDGCEVASTTLENFLQCSCNHLTAFGGSLLVAPNPIDFKEVSVSFLKLEETQNFTVLVTVILTFVLYLVILVIARRADKVDANKAGPSIEVPAPSNALYEYQITITTGVWKNSGTTANVSLMIYGTDGESEVITLGTNIASQRHLFARGNSDTFDLRVERCLGALIAIRIGHDGQGDNPSWSLVDVVITDKQTGEEWMFPSTGWLTTSGGGGGNERLLETLPNDKRFSYDLFMRCSRGFTDGHLWLSVLVKQPRSSFTRAQRTSCCLSVLFSAMLANAMFYRLDGTSEDVLQVGPLMVSWRQVIVGIQSAVIVAPINILIVTLFKLASNKAATTRKTSRCSLTTFLLLLAWFLCLATALASAVFTIFYSLMWGRQVSNQWLSSALISFTQDVTVSEPLKVVLLAVLLTSFLAKKSKAKHGYRTIESDRLQEIYQRSGLYDAGGETVFQGGKPQPTRFKWVLTFVREIWLFSIFVFLLMVVCYGNRSEHRYLMHQSVQSSLKDFDQVANNEDAWSWISGSYAPAMYSGPWYNGMRDNITVYIGDKRSILVGMPQARQLRVKETSCVEESRKLVSVCYGPYSEDDKDKTPYSTPGWIAMTNVTNATELETLCPRPWRYQTAEETDTHPTWGGSALYPGGGYVADFGYSILTAEDIIQSLESGGWLDRKTRVVMFEFTFFNPPTNILSVSTYFYERLPTGGGKPFTRTRTITLFAEETEVYQLYLLFQLLFIIVVFVYVARECYRLFRQRRAYFKSPWNWLELAQILSAVLAVLLHLFKVAETTATIRELQKNIYANVSFDAAILWSEAENGVLALTVFIISLKLLRLVRFNRQVGVFSATLYLGFKRLLSFAVVLSIAFVAFLHFGILVFGATNLRYSTIKSAVYFQLELILGKVKARPMHELAESSQTFGRVFAGVLLVTLTITYMNLVIASINDSLLEAQEVAERGEEDQEVTTSVNGTQRTTGKVDFDRISRAITRTSSTSRTEEKSSKRPKHHKIGLDLVSARMVGPTKANGLNTASLAHSSAASLDFDKISRAIKRMNQGEASVMGDEATAANGRRRVHFSDQELQINYVYLDYSQMRMFALIERMLEESDYEDWALSFD